MTIIIPEPLALIILVGGVVSGFALIIYLIGIIILQRDPDWMKIKKALLRMFIIGLLMSTIPLFIAMGLQSNIP